MAASSINGFVIGKSYSIQIQTPQGALSIPVMTSAERKPMYSKRESIDINGNFKPIPIPKGWQGKFELDVTDDTVDAFIASVESGYYAGLGIDPSSITETRTYPSGAVAQYMYVGVQFMLEEDGTVTGDNKVSQHISWECSQRVKLA